MKNNKWVRSISFNKTNVKDQERLRLIGKKSFSRFIKKLLDEEIERRKISNNSDGVIENNEEVKPKQQPNQVKFNQYYSNKKPQQPNQPKRFY
jgi:hypothetical protein